MVWVADAVALSATFNAIRPTRSEFEALGFTRRDWDKANTIVGEILKAEPEENIAELFTRWSSGKSATEVKQSIMEKLNG